MKNTFWDDGCSNIKYRLPHRKLKNNKTNLLWKEIVFFSFRTMYGFDTIQLINSVNETNEPFVSNIVFAFVQMINQICNSLGEVIYFSNQKSTYSHLLLPILSCQKIYKVGAKLFKNFCLLKQISEEFLSKFWFENQLTSRNDV